jgi:hypothetical protein
MDLKEKVTAALRRALEPVYLELNDDDGVYGFIVSDQFVRTSALDRQKLIDKALHDPGVKFTKAERREIMLIAGLTPAEYAEHSYGENGSGS